MRFLPPLPDYARIRLEEANIHPKYNNVKISIWDDFLWGKTGTAGGSASALITARRPASLWTAAELRSVMSAVAQSRLICVAAGPGGRPVCGCWESAGAAVRYDQNSAAAAGADACGHTSTACPFSSEVTRS